MTGTNDDPMGTRRPNLASLDGRVFDVVVAGGGINGASTAQELAAKGYSVLLVEAGDFGSGASSRSGRLMHFGLRYLDRGEPVWNYLRNPGWFVRQCLRARTTMRHRQLVVRDMPERLVPFRMYFPIYEDDHTAPWQIEAGLRLINLMSRSDPPAQYRRLPRCDYMHTPFVREARNPDRLRAVYELIEYRYDWPERLTADYMLDARRMGAVCRNYTRLEKIERDSDGALCLSLRDSLDAEAGARVTARRLVNMTGAWINRVLEQAGVSTRKYVIGTKGAQIAVRLPREYHGLGFAHFTDESYPFYAQPWRDIHYFAPTETPFEGDPSDVRVTEEDMEWLLHQANRIFPGLGLRRSDVVYHIAGVRPMPYVEGYKGKQNLVPVYHRHDRDGYPDIVSVPGGALMMHRFTGREAARRATRGLRPGNQPQRPNYATRSLAVTPNSPPVVPGEKAVRLANLVDIARHEMPVELSDILLRRTGLIWTGELDRTGLTRAAEAVAPEMGWSEQDCRDQVEKCLTQIRQNHMETGTEASAG